MIMTSNFFLVVDDNGQLWQLEAVLLQQAAYLDGLINIVQRRVTAAKP
jgi:hypothetical protein